MLDITRTSNCTQLTCGDPAAVGIHAQNCQCLFDIAARSDAEEGIRQGLDEAKMGRVRLAKEFFTEFEAELDTPR